MKFVTTRYQDMQCEPHKKRGREGKKDLVTDTGTDRGQCSWNPGASPKLHEKWWGHHWKMAKTSNGRALIR